MKCALVFAAAGLVAIANAATCEYKTVSANLQSLGKPIASCMTATGNSYNLARASAPPTEEQAAAICAKCPEFVAAVTALPPWPDCTMMVGGSDQTLTSYFDKMIGGCKAGNSGDAATTTTEMPTATTSAPSVEGTTTEGSGSQGKDVVTANSSSTDTDTNEVTTAPTNQSTPVSSATTSAGYSVHVGAFAASAFATTMAIVF